MCVSKIANSLAHTQLCLHIVPLYHYAQYYNVNLLTVYTPALAIPILKCIHVCVTTEVSLHRKHEVWFYKGSMGLPARSRVTTSQIGES